MGELELADPSIALVLAAVTGLVLMPLSVQAGKRFGFIAHPRLLGQGKPAVSVLGGAALALCVCVGFVFATGFPIALGPLTAVAFALLALGFLDDRGNSWIFQPSARLAVHSLVALTAWLSGLRADTPGILGLAATLVFLVTVMNSFNLLDNMDGVAGTTCAALAAGVTAIALMNGQFLVASLGAALFGATVAFLCHNFRSARIYLGNGGSVFVGFVLGVAALKLRPGLDLPWAVLAVPVLFAVPLVDTTVVVVSRFFNRRPVMQGGVDHISHRLVRIGLTHQGAAIAHGAGSVAAATFVVLAVALDLPTILLVPVILAGVVAVALLRVPIYSSPIEVSGVPDSLQRLPVVVAKLPS